MNQPTRQLKDFFTFSKSERRGILVLLIIIFLIISANLLLPTLFIPHAGNFSEFEKEVMAFEEALKRCRKDDSSGQPATRLHPFPFDPNHLPYEQWKALGLSERQISTIYRYEEKGGCFRVQDDLSRIYVISDEEFRILKPYVLLPETLIIDKPAGNSNDIRNLHPFTFDPNLMNETLATEIGLRERLAANMISYLRAGGRFRNADDLMRIYSITDEEFRALKPFIRIEPDTATEIVTEKRAAQLPVIELNAADTLDLQQLRGIGSSFAGRIVKYRELLGGYTDKRQLLEVYGMDSTRYLGIEYRVIVNPDSVKRINVNTASIKEMIRHPYIEFYLAKSIILHREKLGGFSALDQVGDADMMYEELFIRIRPYITIE